MGKLVQMGDKCTETSTKTTKATAERTSRIGNTDGPRGIVCIRCNFFFQLTQNHLTWFHRTLQAGSMWFQKNCRGIWYQVPEWRWFRYVVPELNGYITGNPVEKCKQSVKHTPKKKPRKSLTYKAFESVLAVWTKRNLGFQNFDELFKRMPPNPSVCWGCSVS